MKQSTRRLFSLLLALVMALCLAVPAFADEGGQPEKELRFAWLMNDGNGFYVEDFVLNSKDNPFEGGLGMAPAGDSFAIFFIWNNKTSERESFVVPEGDGNITVTKLAADEIARNSKQTQYYVKLHMNEFKDGEVTANGLSFHVNAVLPDFGFYSAETPSENTLLGNEIAGADLTGGALYFCTPYAGEEGRDTVTKVEKDPNTVDFNKLYDVESVKDGLWKITLNDMGRIQLENGGGIWINLILEVKQPDGSTREDGRSINVMGEDQGPELFFADLASEWDDEAGQDIFFVNKDYGGQGNGKQVHAGYEHVGIFGTIKDGENAYTDHGFNWDAFTPVDVNSLKTTGGITVESISGQAKRGENWGKYFVRVTVPENGREYQVTSGDYSITIDSGLPEVGVYSGPEASFDTWAGEYEYPYHPAKDNTYYIISTAADDDGMSNRHLTGAKLAGWEENKLVDLEKVSDNVYRLTIKDTSRSRFHVELDLTWADFMGNTWTDTNWGFGDFWRAPFIVASDTKLTDQYDENLPYAEAAGKVSTSVAMAVGEKQVYLYLTPIRPDEILFRAYGADNAVSYRSSNDALTLSFDKADPARFTLSASKPGTYEIWAGGKDWDYENIKLTHAGGKPYTDAERQAWYEDDSIFWDITDDGKMIVWGADQTRSDAVPFEEYRSGDTCEIGLRSQELIDYGWQHLTVTVTGEAKTFTDVKPANWYYSAVNWAVARGIAAGTGGSTFSPDRTCTHGEIITMLWNSQGQKKAAAASPLKVSVWFQDAVDWAYENKVIDGTFNADTLCDRATAANYIWKFAGSPTGSPATSFADVPAGAAYIQGLNWAVEKGIVSGTGNNTFLPEKTCSRAEIVTLLFNAYGK